MGITSGVFMSAPPLVSVLWFPVRERTTATALAVSGGFVGESLGFITGNSLPGL